MARRLFGTDGVRGVANDKLTPELALSLGIAAGKWISETGRHRRICIGRDTRRSGSMLESALAAGFCSSGIDVTLLGVAPTPAVAFAARTAEYDLGVIVSASHNPAPDNGIKFVTHEGKKTSDEVEELLENLMVSPPNSRPQGGSVGEVNESSESIERYLDMLARIVPEGLKGLKVAVDGANGAAFRLGPRILERLGAEVVSTGCSPDGVNINRDGGATKPGNIQSFTVESGAAVGVAFDGDADRAVFSDENGELINGDRTIGAWAAAKQAAGKLAPSVVVGTVMSNGGFEAYLTSLGIELKRAPVGDKYVSQWIESSGALVGGEQSGHIVFPEHGPTGDGLATMLELLAVVVRSGLPASALTSAYAPWPQLLVNVGISSTQAWSDSPAVISSLKLGEQEIAGRGRIVVRASGTQPMIRVMVEADDVELRDRVADRIVAAMSSELNGVIHGRVDLTHALGD